MLKTIARLEHKIGDRLFHFTCDQDSPVTEVKEALCQFLAFATQIEKAVAANNPPASEEKPPEVPQG